MAPYVADNMYCSKSSSNTYMWIWFIGPNYLGHICIPNQEMQQQWFCCQSINGYLLKINHMSEIYFLCFINQILLRRAMRYQLLSSLLTGVMNILNYQTFICNLLVQLLSSSIRWTKIEKSLAIVGFILLRIVLNVFLKSI